MISYRHIEPKWILDTAENYIDRLREALNSNDYEAARSYTEEAFGILQQLEHQLWQKAKLAAKAAEAESVAQANIEVDCAD